MEVFGTWQKQEIDQLPKQTVDDVQFLEEVR